MKSIKMYTRSKQVSFKGREPKPEDRNLNLLFVLDEKNYRFDMPVIERYAVRGIICKNGKYAMQQSKKGDYKIPGGGVDTGETLHQALAREVREETGLIIRPQTIREIGEVLELRQDIYEQDKRYIAHSYHYFCEVDEEVGETAMTQSELEKGFHLAWATLEEIIEGNAKCRDANWVDRDVEFLKWLKKEGLSQ